MQLPPVTSKFKQPSFWLAILGAVGTAVHAVAGDNPIIAAVLAVVTAALAAVDNVTDAKVDAARVMAVTYVPPMKSATP